MKIPVIQGRGLDALAGSGDAQGILINRTLARSGFLGDNPIGAQVYSSGPVPSTVVGIVDDVRQLGLDINAGSQVFVDYNELQTRNAMAATSPPYFAVRTDDDPRALIADIRSVVRQLDGRAVVDNVATMEQLVANSMVRPRLYAVLVGLFAVVAVTLAVVGIYGVVSFSVVQRTREIGIRIALGARRSQVLALVMSQVLLLTFIGIVTGVAGGTAVTRYLAGMLFGVTPMDPATFIAASALFAAVAAVGAFVPARRATIVDPIAALRAE
jgi:putative ABC transport system permease protein